MRGILLGILFNYCHDSQFPRVKIARSISSRSARDSKIARLIKNFGKRIFREILPRDSCSICQASRTFEKREKRKKASIRSASSYILKRRPVTSRAGIKRSRDAVNYYFEQIKACPPRTGILGVINESTDKRSASVLAADRESNREDSTIAATVLARDVTWVVERENGNERRFRDASATNRKRMFICVRTYVRIYWRFVFNSVRFGLITQTYFESEIISFGSVLLAR